MHLQVVACFCCLHAICLATIQAKISKDIIEAIPEPKPHNNTVATLLKILIEKGFVANEVHGRNHYYYPIVSKQDYTSGSINSIVENYFDGSFADVVSFMVDKKKLKLKDIELLLNQLKTKK